MRADEGGCHASRSTGAWRDQRTQLPVFWRTPVCACHKLRSQKGSRRRAHALPDSSKQGPTRITIFILNGTKAIRFPEVTYSQRHGGPLAARPLPHGRQRSRCLATTLGEVHYAHALRPDTCEKGEESTSNAMPVAARAIGGAQVSFSGGG